MVYVSFEPPAKTIPTIHHVFTPTNSPSPTSNLQVSSSIIFKPPLRSKGGLLKSACLSVFRHPVASGATSIHRTPQVSYNVDFRQRAARYAHLYAAALSCDKFTQRNEWREQAAHGIMECLVSLESPVREDSNDTKHFQISQTCEELWEQIEWKGEIHQFSALSK